MENTENYISSLIDKYGNMVLRLAYTYLKNRSDAEDVVQEVFLTLIEKQPAFNDENHQRLWLVRTTINACKDRLRLFWNRNRCYMEAVGEASAFDSYNIDSTVLNAVMSLAEKYRIVVYMYYYEEYTTGEIAKLTGKRESTVRSLLHRARTQLRSVLKEEYDFEQ